MTAQITQGRILLDPDELEDVEALRSELRSAYLALLSLSQLRHAMELSICRMGNDLADIAEAHRSGDTERLKQVAKRVEAQVAFCEELRLQAAQVH